MKKLTQEQHDEDHIAFELVRGYPKMAQVIFNGYEAFPYGARRLKAIKAKLAEEGIKS